MNTPLASRGAEAILEILKQALGEQYAFLRQIGRGAYSLVFEVRNRQLERREALKVFVRVLEETAAARFVKETRLAAALDHPNIVKVFSYGEARGIPWYTMQLVDGTSLAEFLRQNGALGVDLFFRLAHPILDALAYSHAAGIIHRDIKPQNLLIDRHLRPYIADFGLAKVLEEPGLTSTGSVLGTPGYLAPEVLAGKPPSFAADVYALGVTFYQMLAGRLPFEGSDAFELMLGSLQKDPPPLSQFRTDLPEGVVQAVMKAIARRPEDRFPSVEALRVALNLSGEDAMGAVFSRAEDALPFSTLTFPEQTAITMDVRRQQKKRWVFLAGGPLVVAAVAAVLWQKRPAAVAPSPSTVVASQARTEGESPTPTQAPMVQGAVLATPQTTPKPTRTPVPTAVPTLPPPALALASPPRPLRELVIPVDASVPEDCLGLAVPVLVSLNAQGQVLRLKSLRSVPPPCLALAQSFLQALPWAPAQNAHGEPVASTLATEVHFATGQEGQPGKEDTL